MKCGMIGFHIVSAARQAFVAHLRVWGIAEGISNNSERLTPVPPIPEYAKFIEAHGMSGFIWR
jgi:hypothetical protein